MYKTPPPETKVTGVDEKGPVSAKTYLAPRWSEAGYRPHVEADYGRRGKVWVFGGFEPHTGAAMTVCAPRRDTHHFLLFLEALVEHWPHHDPILILDDLSIHRTMDVLLWSLAHTRVRFLFQPTYAPWLNLIEPWRKTLRSLALEGVPFEAETSIPASIYHAVDYWDQRKHPYYWRKAA